MHFGTDTVHKRCTDPTIWGNGQFGVRDIMLLYKSTTASDDCGKNGKDGDHPGKLIHRWLRIGLTGSFQPSSRSGQIYQSMVVHKNDLYFIDGVKSMLNKASLDQCKTPSTDCLATWDKYKLKKPGHIFSISDTLYLFGPQLEKLSFGVLGLSMSDRIPSIDKN